MKILSLQVENIKRIKAVSIKPSGNSVIISGKNGNGKSSTIDSIAMVLGGKKMIPSDAVRKGEKNAKIEVNIGDYIVTRHWTSPEKSYLSLRNKDDAKITNAQSMLDRIIGDLSFDPLAFATMEPKKRADLLKDLVGVDFEAHDAKIEKEMEKRRDLKRDGLSIKARLSSPEFANLPDEEPKPSNVDDIMKEKAQADEKNAQIDKAFLERSKIDIEISKADQEIMSIQKQISEAKKMLKNAQDKKDCLLDSAELMDKESLGKKIDTSEYDLKIKESYELRNKLAYFKQREAIEKELEQSREAWSAADDEIERLRAEKISMLSDAKMPIDGLNFDQNEVTFNGVLFSNLSTAEQIKVSMSISIAMNPRLKVAMIHNGSLLDSDAMAEIEKMAIEKDFQVWIEKVSDSPDGNSVFIEDGEVKDIE